MNRSKRSMRRVQIRNMQDLAAEKQRLQHEITRAETGISQDYRALVDALTFRNLITTIAEEIIAANIVVSQAYSIIKPLFKKKKRKKDVGRETKDE